MKAFWSGIPSILLAIEFVCGSPSEPPLFFPNIQAPESVNNAIISYI
jgi:hypothetical protein